MACLLLALGFFLPWVEGANILDFRSFSGFDLARLVRNFEINAGTDTGLGKLRATALALYLVPALGVNAAMLECLAWVRTDARPAARWASLVAGAYSAAVLGAVLVLSQVPLNDFEQVVGAPAWGFAVVALGAALFVWLGAFARRGREPVHA
jgi:hypothetical protein